MFFATSKKRTWALLMMAFATRSDKGSKLRHLHKTTIPLPLFCKKAGVKERKKWMRNSNATTWNTLPGT